MSSRKVKGSISFFLINADWNGVNCAPLMAYLKLQDDGTQTLTVYRKQHNSTDVTLVKAAGLSSDFVTLRLLIDPAGDTVNIQVNGQDEGTYMYMAFPPGDNDRFATIMPSGSNAEFDHISIRVGEGN